MGHADVFSFFNRMKMITGKMLYFSLTMWLDLPTPLRTVNTTFRSEVSLTTCSVSPPGPSDLGLQAARPLSGMPGSQRPFLLGLIGCPVSHCWDPGHHPFSFHPFPVVIFLQKLPEKRCMEGTFLRFCV